MLVRMPSPHERLRAARLYLVCDRRPGGRPLADVLEPALRGGVDIFQLRDKEASDDELLAAAGEARALCADTGALFLLNDRPDLAVAAGADGVHVGQDDLPVAQARAAMGPDAIVGLSTHAPEQLTAAFGERPDYVAVGRCTPRRRSRGGPPRGCPTCGTRRPPRARCPGSRSAGSTRRPPARWSPPGPPDRGRPRDRRGRRPERAARALRAVLDAEEERRGAA